MQESYLQSVFDTVPQYLHVTRNTRILMIQINDILCKTTEKANILVKVVRAETSERSRDNFHLIVNTTDQFYQQTVYYLSNQKIWPTYF